MPVVIPINTAIIVMIVISGVYCTLTVLFTVCTCCNCYHRRKPKIGGRDDVPMRSGPRELEVAAAGIVNPSMSWGSGQGSTGSEGEAQGIHDKRTGASGGNLPQVVSGSGSGGPSPHLLKHLVLPPIGHIQVTPSLVQSSRTSYEMKTVHSHAGKEMVLEDIDGRSPEEAPAPTTESQGFRVLTVHKSTLKRKKPASEMNPTSEKGSERGALQASYNPESTANYPPKLKHMKAPPRPPKPLAPLKQVPKKPKVARTDSTKPLMEEDNESPTDLITEGAIWSGQHTLSEGQCVLENVAADDRSPKSLGVLQEDLMEIITAL